MREQHPDPLMDINPDIAADLGLSDGDWALIETRRGVIKMKARIKRGVTLPSCLLVDANGLLFDK